MWLHGVSQYSPEAYFCPHWSRERPTYWGTSHQPMSRLRPCLRGSVDAFWLLSHFARQSVCLRRPRARYQKPKVRKLGTSSFATDLVCVASPRCFASSVSLRRLVRDREGMLYARSRTSSSSSWWCWSVPSQRLLIGPVRTRADNGSHLSPQKSILRS